MRTTVDVKKELLDEVVKVAKERNRNNAIGKALEEYIRRKKIEEIKTRAGKIAIVDNLKELEEEELKTLSHAKWS